MRKRLAIILVLAVAIQAILAVAFIHHSDQSGNEFISFDHVQVVSTGGDLDYLGGSQNTPIKDFSSHYCSHYIGVFTNCGREFLASLFPIEKFYFYDFNLTSISISPLFHPPIL